MIAVDVMGGDHAPHQILLGALNAAKRHQPVMLFGPLELVRVELEKLDRSWQNYPIRLSDAPQMVGMAENPVLSVKQKRESSLVKAVESVKTRECSGVISAGNSGALMAASTLFLGRCAGVERPAIAGLLPGLYGNAVGLDLGANISCRPHHLVQFAQMGSMYAQQTLGLQSPRVGLLSNGQEDEKGSDLTKETFPLLKNSSLNFIGNVEPYDVFVNKADVVVCDGFSGNIFLKTMEALHEIFLQLTVREFEVLANRIGQPEQIHAFRGEICDNMERNFSYVKTGGAVLLGVEGRVVVCHGNSDASDIERAIEFAAR